MERDDFRLAEDLVVTWEYTDGVPILGVFFPKFIYENWKKFQCIYTITYQYIAVIGINSR
jgi:hypothetical protein